MSYFSKILQENEAVSFIKRKSFIGQLFHFIFAGFFLALPFFLSFFLFRQGWWGIIMFFLLFLLGLHYFSLIWLKWFFNVLILTDQRLLIIRQKSFLIRKVKVILIDDIREITYLYRSFWQKVFCYGSLLIKCKDKKVYVFKPIFRAKNISRIMASFLDNSVDIIK